MAQKKFLDYEGTAYLINEIKARYVEQEEGKGLSTNDFTDEYIQQIADLVEGSNIEVITEDEINGIFS